MTAAPDHSPEAAARGFQQEVGSPQITDHRWEAAASGVQQEAGTPQIPTRR